jgi:lactoylglutathione lyase
MFREAFPILYVDDAARSATFYADNFDFEVAFRWPTDGELEFAFLRLEPLGIGVVKGERGVEPQFELCLYCDDTDEAAARLRANGVRELQAPADQPWGERLAFFEDPDGNRIHVTARLDL